MRKIVMRSMKYSTILVAILLLSSFHISSFRMFTQYRETDQLIAEHLKEKNLDFQIGYYQVGDRKMRYLTIDNKAKDNLIFIHGAPGSLSKYDKYFNDSLLKKHYNLYVIDRPGYGYSGFGEAEVHIDKNVEDIKPVFDLIKNQTGKNILVGQSYGGPIASRIAMLYPELVDGLVLINPAIQPGEERTYGISNWMVKEEYCDFFPTMLVTASKEKLAHKAELKTIEHDWKKIHCRVTMIQGLNDELVYPSNISYLQKNISDSLLQVIPLAGETHFLSKATYPKIVSSFLEMVAK